MQPGGGAFVVFTRGVHRPRGFTGEDSPTTTKKKGLEKEFKRNTKTVQHEQLDAAAVLRGVVTRDQHEGRSRFPGLSFPPPLTVTSSSSRHFIRIQAASCKSRRCLLVLC